MAGILQMRRIFILILLFSGGAACAGAQQCKQQFGEDKSLPPEVAAHIRVKLKGYKLVDRKDCVDALYWLAVPPNQPVNRPRVIGSERLVVMDKTTKEITIVLGQ